MTKGPQAGNAIALAPIHTSEEGGVAPCAEQPEAIAPLVAPGELGLGGHDAVAEVCSPGRLDRTDRLKSNGLVEPFEQSLA